MLKYKSIEKDLIGLLSPKNKMIDNIKKAAAKFLQPLFLKSFLIMPQLLLQLHREH
jgi:hypothetical protein